MKRREFIGGVAATLAMSALVLCGAGLVARADPSVMFSVIAQLKAGRRSPVRYSSASTNCVLEIQTPGTKGFATLVWLHGGGLTAGRRQHLPGFDTNRFASVAVEYRLVPEGTFTNCVEDAAAAVAWTLDHIADYGGDPKKVFVGGHSAGGWLTYMVGFDPRGLRAHGHSPDELAGLIPLSGQATTHYNVRAFRGDGEPRYAPKIDEWAPLAYVRGGLPPTCIVTGQRGLDIRGRVEENELMAASLRACGTRMVEFHELEGCGHGTCMKGLAPIAHAFMRTALQPTFRNSLGAANGEAPSLAYDPAKRRYYAVFSGEKDLTVWRARHAADILSARDFKVVAKGEAGAAFRTPRLMRLADGRWRVYASAPTVAVAESKTADPFDGFGPFEKLDWAAVDPCVFTAADGRTCMAAVELPAKRLAIREMASPTTFAGEPVALAEGLEGPAFLVAPNGRLFLAATENGMRADNACVRLLAFDGGKLTDARSWTKLDAPLVVGGNGVWGPGFASFFASPDGRETWCAFHAMGAPAEGRQPAKLYARIQKVDFGADGVPSIGVAAGDRQDLPCPSGE